MEKENKFKLKIPRIFTSSCKTQDLSEVIDHKVPIFTPENTIFLQTPLMEVPQENEDDDYPFHSPVIKPKQSHSSSSSMMYCKPRCPETFDQMVRENCIIAGNPLPRRKIAGKYSLLSPAVEYSGGRRCPPASPASPLFSQKQGKRKKNKKKNKGFYKNENTLLKKKENPDKIYYSSSNETDIGDWFSSDDEREEDETETLFSLKSVSFSSKSISLSSDSDNPMNKSSRSLIRARPRTRRRKPGSRLRKESRAMVKEEEGEEVGVVPLEGKVKDTFAVVKSSSDPYNDFRTSMVEMIIEKQIFGAKELEQLLHCFLSLNSPHHHRVIVEVFTEIWDALFSYCS
ncbi:transcription repressor OFP8-like [Chenopodium quinoa]|uniref:transcription repressor OFP8-like n=1 Tax=Chenopodium quinoa TaxID=63459 RepID=UPI000B770CFD|nr:transcription repressor OFP8-like [Chenopodium quinoa]